MYHLDLYILLKSIPLNVSLFAAMKIPHFRISHSIKNNFSLEKLHALAYYSCVKSREWTSAYFQEIWAKRIEVFSLKLHLLVVSFCFHFIEKRGVFVVWIF